MLSFTNELLPLSGMAASGDVSFSPGEAPAKPARVQVDHEEITTLSMSPEKIKVHPLFIVQINIRDDITISQCYFNLNFLERGGGGYGSFRIE